jgi:hypothetical protein
MNLVQITEQLKNPAITVPQLMQYANNSNPQVPSYVALAEMQRRQSMQAPAQVPQETVKDQLGAQLMGLPAAPGANPGAAPQQPPQQPQGIQQQPPQQQVQQPEQTPMPQPKPALPMQPGMAGGGLTSIPLNMHHDFASGGIIAFADGGYPAGYEIPEKINLEQAQTEREQAEQARGIGGDPYAEAKRRYAEIEAKQKEAEKGAGLDRIIASLAAMGGGGPRQFGDVMASYANTSSKMESEQRKEAEQNAMKMADLHTLWAKEQDALKRAALAADMGQVDKSRTYQTEALKLRQEFDKVKASTTSAEAAAQNARTLEEQRKFEQEQYPAKFALEERKANAAIKRDMAEAIRAGRPSEAQERLAIYKKDPAAYMAMYGTGKGVLTQDQMTDNWQKMSIIDKMARKARAGGDILKAEQDYYKEVSGLPLSSAPSNGGGTASKMTNEQLKAALGIK